MADQVSELWCCHCRQQTQIEIIELRGNRHVVVDRYRKRERELRMRTIRPNDRCIVDLQQGRRKNNITGKLTYVLAMGLETGKAQVTRCIRFRQFPGYL